MPDLPKPQGIPDNWIEKSSDTPGGKEYINPNNPNDRVRVMPGNPSSKYPSQQRPYVIDQNGSFRNVDGKSYSRRDTRSKVRGPHPLPTL
jgi:hypothetical protein